MQPVLAINGKRPRNKKEITRVQIASRIFFIFRTKICTTRSSVTVNPLLSPPRGAYFFQTHLIFFFFLGGGGGGGGASYSHSLMGTAYSQSDSKNFVIVIIGTAYSQSDAKKFAIVMMETAPSQSDSKTVLF